MSDTGANAQDQSDAVRAVLERINSAWLKYEPDKIADAMACYFHEQVVFVGPGLVPVVQGRQAGVQSYVDFRRQATVHSCEIDEPVIHVVADTAVVTGKWRIAYSLGENRYEETGQDAYVLSRTSDQWQVIWRAMLPDRCHPVPSNFL